MCRPLQQQCSYWTNFVFFPVKPQDCATIIVGSKSDLLSSSELSTKTVELINLAQQHKFDPPIILSSLKLLNISDLQTKISHAAQKVISSLVQEIPLTYVGYLDNFHNSKTLIMESALPCDVLQFFHNIGEIVYSRSGMNARICVQDIKLDLGLVCVEPQILAKLMGLFICPDIHELALLSFIEKLKFPRRAVLSSSSVKMRIQGFLHQFKDKYPECTEDTVNQITTMMEDLDFLIPLSDQRVMIMMCWMEF